MHISSLRILVLGTEYKALWNFLEVAPYTYHVQLWYVRLEILTPLLRNLVSFSCVKAAFHHSPCQPVEISQFVYPIPLSSLSFSNRRKAGSWKRQLLQSKPNTEKQAKKSNLDCTSTTMASKTCCSEYKPLASIMITQEYNLLWAAEWNSSLWE